MATSSNILALQAWGRFPKSPRRRRVALRSFLTRTLLYVGLLAMVATIFAVICLKTRGSVDDALPVVLMYFSFMMGAWLCVAAPFQVENRFSNAAQLLANQHDYRLAGITGRDILKGIAAPQLAGSTLFAAVHLATALGLFIYELSAINHWPKDVLSLSVPVMIIIAPVFDLLAGTPFNIAQWRYSSRGFRSLKTACFVFLSPVTMLVCFPFLFSYSVRSMIEWLIFLEIVLILIRSWWAAAEWRKTKRWLDGDDGAQSRVPVNPVKALSIQRS